MRDKELKQALDEMYDITKVLKKEGKSAAECRYMEIVYTRLLLIFDALSFLRTLFFFLLGMLAVHFFIA